MNEMTPVDQGPVAPPPAPTKAPVSQTQGPPRTSEKIDKLYDALVAAQGEFVPIWKDRAVDVGMKAGGSYGFHYATYDNIVTSIRPILAKHGLGFSHRTKMSPVGLHTVITRLFHKTGQWEDFYTPLIGDIGRAQSFGSAESYAQRYGLSGALGLATKDDDDGNVTDGNAVTVTNQNPNEAEDRAYANALLTEIRAAKSPDEVKAIEGLNFRLETLKAKSVAAHEYVTSKMQEHVALLETSPFGDQQ